MNLDVHTAILANQKMQLAHCSAHATGTDIGPPSSNEVRVRTEIMYKWEMFCREYWRSAKSVMQRSVQYLCLETLWHSLSFSNQLPLLFQRQYTVEQHVVSKLATMQK